MLKWNYGHIKINNLNIEYYFSVRSYETLNKSLKGHKGQSIVSYCVYVDAHGSILDGNAHANPHRTANKTIQSLVEGISAVRTQNEEFKSDKRLSVNGS